MTGILSLTAISVSAVPVTDLCPDAASKAAIYDGLEALLKSAQAQDNGGFGFNMWGAVVNRDGIVCAVAYTGDDRADQWPGSRVIAAQKANTANSFSLTGFALSTGNLHQATQNGGSLFGLQESNPVDVSVAYGGDSSSYGTKMDPMVGGKIGGVNVFGGGLALYSSTGEIVGAVGVSGSSSCEDHNIAWRIRNAANFDFVPAGPSPAGNDQIIFTDETQGSGFEHPLCGATSPENETAIRDALPATQTVASGS